MVFEKEIKKQCIETQAIIDKAKVNLGLDNEPSERYCLKCKERMQYEGIMNVRYKGKMVERHLWHCYNCAKNRTKKVIRRMSYCGDKPLP